MHWVLTLCERNVGKKGFFTESHHELALFYMSLINSFIANDGHQVSWSNKIPCSLRFSHWTGQVVSWELIIPIPLETNVSLEAINSKKTRWKNTTDL